MRVSPFFPAVVLCALVVSNDRAIQAQQPDPTVTDPRPRRMAVAGLPGPAASVTFWDTAGHEITAELDPRDEDGRFTVAFRPDAQFIVKPRVVHTMALPASGRLTLPGGIVAPAPGQLNESGEMKSAWFRLVCGASPVPAPWNARLGGYVTRLTFGLTRPPQLPATVRPAIPIVVKVAFAGVTGSELPTLTLEEPGLEHEKTVELQFQPQTPSPRLLVRSTLADVDLELTALPRLELRSEQREILGFGLETGVIVVESVQPHGEPRPFPTATPVAVELTGGARAEAGEIAFPAGAAWTSFRVRSAGVGTTSIRAFAAGVSGETSLRARFPTGPLIAALVGGAMGGYARRFGKAVRRHRATRFIAEGISVGLIAFVAGVLGVGYLRLPPAIVATEAGAFLVGALAGFVGVMVLRALAKRPGHGSAT